MREKRQVQTKHENCVFSSKILTKAIVKSLAFPAWVGLSETISYKQYTRVLSKDQGSDRIYKELESAVKFLKELSALL